MAHILPDDEAPDHTPRKGRSNAIVTYETLARIDNQVASIAARFDVFVAGQHDHETRLRYLEGVAATMVAASATRRGDFQWVWGASFTLLNAGLALATFIITKGTH